MDDTRQPNDVARDGFSLGRRSPSRPLLVIALACAALELVGSFSFGTTRTWSGGAAASFDVDNDGMSQRDGAARWAGWGLLGGLVALGALVGGAVAPALLRAPLAVVAAVALLGAATPASRYWFVVRDELAAPRSYRLDMAAGLPVVAVVGTVGGMVALALAVSWLRAAVTAARPT